MYRGIPVVDARFGQAYVDPEPVEFPKQKIVDGGFVESGQGYGLAGLRKSTAAQSPRQNELLATFFSRDVLPEGW